MKTFIKTKLKISDVQTNIDKYRLAANITEYHIISKLILQLIIITKVMMIRQLFRVKILKSVHIQETGLFWSSEAF